MATNTLKFKGRNSQPAGFESAYNLRTDQGTTWETEDGYFVIADDEGGFVVLIQGEGNGVESGYRHPNGDDLYLRPVFLDVSFALDPGV